MPDEGEHIWEWFWMLSAGRSSNGFGANPISYSEIAFWAGLVGAEPSPEDVTAIRAMDGTMLAEMAKRRN